MDDGAAVHFMDESLYQTVSSRPNAKAYYVKKEEDTIIEREVHTYYLGAE